MANPIRQAAVRRKIGYFVAIIALFTVTLFWRGKLDVPFSQREVRDTAGVVVQPANFTQRLSNASILGQAESLELRELDQGDPEITGSLARLSLVGVRGPVITGLWWAANEKQKRNEWHELELLVNAVIQLQPNFITPWIFQGWNIAYNVSVENDKLGDMFFFIARGIELLAKGDRANTKTHKHEGKELKIGSPDLRHNIGFFYQNKFGVSDKVQTLRCLMQLATIAPGDRVPSIVDNNGRVDPERFRKWCIEHPQLVRRLKTKLNCNSPEDVVQFLKDNEKIPSLYKPGTNEKAEATAQYPTLPPKFPEAADYDYNPGCPFDDRFDAFDAARAWFTYANTVVPPAKTDNGEPLPWATPRPGDSEYNPFLHRIPRQPTLIIFKIAPARAQSYLAERLAKEGWFDEASTWSPSDGGSAAAWFGSSAGEVQLKAGSNSQREYERAWAQWDSAGRSWGLVLEPARFAALTERARRTPFGTGSNLPPDMSPEEMQRSNIRPEDMTARKALAYYEQNRHMTNFAFFLDSSLAEKDPLTVRARRLLFEADQARQAAENVRATRLYTEALARWREVLAKFPRFHRTLGDTTEESTFEYELALVNLVKEDGGVRERAGRATDSLQAVSPALAALDTAKPDYQQALAEDEALARIVAEQFAFVFPGLPPDSEEQRAVRRVTLVGEAMAAAAGPLAAVAPGNAPVVRSLIDTEFNWMKESTKAPVGGGVEVVTVANPEDYWVRPNIRDAMRSRLGLKRMATQSAEQPPEAPAGAAEQPPAAK